MGPRTWRATAARPSGRQRRVGHLLPAAEYARDAARQRWRWPRRHGRLGRHRGGDGRRRPAFESEGRDGAPAASRGVAGPAERLPAAAGRLSWRAAASGWSARLWRAAASGRSSPGLWWGAAARRTRRAAARVWPASWPRRAAATAWSARTRAAAAATGWPAAAGRTAAGLPAAGLRPLGARLSIDYKTLSRGGPRRATETDLGFLCPACCPRAVVRANTRGDGVRGPGAPGRGGRAVTQTPRRLVA